MSAPGGAFLERYGSWAVVTGASDGIGQAFAQQLAAKGLNLVPVWCGTLSGPQNCVFLSMAAL